jgi:hypothetical protein
MKQSYERYLAMARAEAQNGNTVAAENYYQHAEHYFRSMFSGTGARPEASAEVDTGRLAMMRTVVRLSFTK